VNILATYPNKMQNRIDHNRAERKLLEKINSPDCVQEYIPSYMEGTDPENIPDIASTVPNFARFTPEELEQINPSSRGWNGLTGKTRSRECGLTAMLEKADRSLKLIRKVGAEPSSRNWQMLLNVGMWSLMMSCERR